MGSCPVAYVDLCSLAAPPAVLCEKLWLAETNAVASCTSFHMLEAMTLAGLEPAIFGSEDQRLIH